MKAGHSLGVPLTAEAIQVLNALPRDGDYVFQWRGERIDDCNTLAFQNAVKAAKVEPLRCFGTRASRRIIWQGWDKLKNGDLLTAAENAGFEVFLTTDKNIRYQQDLTRRKIAIVVLGRQQWPQLRAHVQSIVEAVNEATLGSYIEVDIPSV
jgi:hypothetical protein